MNLQMIDRYVDLAAAAVPEGQRAGLQIELRANITDMVNDRVAEGVPEEEAVEAVLGKLGDPKELESKYLGRPRALLSGEYYHYYLKALQVSLPLGLGLYMLFTVVALLAGWQDSWSFGELPGGILGILSSIFGVVTLVFIVLERTGTAMGAPAWTPKQLIKEVPKRYRIPGQRLSSASCSPCFLR